MSRMLERARERVCATERNFVLCLEQMDNHNGFCSSFDLRYVEFKSKFMVSRRWLISPRSVFSYRAQSTFAFLFWNVVLIGIIIFGSKQKAIVKLVCGFCSLISIFCFEPYQQAVLVW